MPVFAWPRPAEEWVEGLPAGNGRIGFMAYGLPGDERFALNADRLFRKNIEKRFQTAHLMPALKALIAEGRGLEADALFQAAAKDQPEGVNPYQPFATLRALSPGARIAENYRREIDLTRGVVRLQYRMDGALVEWAALACEEENVIALRRETDEPADMMLFFDRQDDPDCRWGAAFSGDRFEFSAEFVEGVRFRATIRLDTDGRMEADGQNVMIAGATRIDLFIELYTDYDEEKPPADRLLQLKWAELFARHEERHSALFDRMDLSLGGESDIDIQSLYDEAQCGGDVPVALYEVLLKFSRYLLMGASRPGGLPVNLQGLWLEDIRPMWDAGFTTDMNIQMAYWMAETANLSTCHIPLFDWVDKNADRMAAQCRDIFGIEGGAYIPQYTDAFMTPASWAEFSPFQVLWGGAAPWIARHYFEHWLYTRDEEFARARAYPLMKRCMTFYRGLMERDEMGRLCVRPSCNPENWAADGGQLVDTATMDIALVRELARNMARMAHEVKIVDEDADAWRAMVTDIQDFPIDSDGALREWIDPRDVMDPSHRHLSHLYGLYPSDLFTSEALRRAARKALDKRLACGLKNSATWSFAWYACLYARLGDGNAALRFIDHIVKGGLLPNLLTVHNDWRDESEYSHMVAGKVFQIDALLGLGSAILQMLIRPTEDGFELLPALPDRFKAHGEVRGIRAPGMVLDFSWEQGNVLTIAARAERDVRATALLPGGERIKIALCAGEIWEA